MDNLENKDEESKLEASNEETKTEETPVVEEAKEETPVEEASVVEETKIEETPVVEEVKEETSEDVKENKNTEPKKKKLAQPVKVEKVKREEPKEEIKKEPKAVKTEDKKENTVKSDVEKKIRKQMEKKQEKKERMGIYRIGEYLKEEHKWENWVFLGVSIVVLLLGLLILNGSLIVRENFPLIGSNPSLFAWILVGIASVGILYGLYPFFKPAFPEFKKITWLTLPKFVANSIRVFLFIIIFVGLFILYDTLMAELFMLIFR